MNSGGKLGIGKCVSALAIGYLSAVGASYKPLYASLAEYEVALTILRTMTILELNRSDLSIPKKSMECEYHEGRAWNGLTPTLLSCRDRETKNIEFTQYWDIPERSSVGNFRIQGIHYDDGGFHLSGSATLERNGTIHPEE